MHSQYHIIKTNIIGAIKSAIKECGLDKYCKDIDVERSFEISKRYGDFSSSITFRISKAANIASNEVAEKIASKISSEYLKTITLESGFINFHINRERFTKLVIEQILKEGPTTENLGDKERVIVEYPSTNPVHPLHVGQLRNFLIGDCISNVYQANGYDVEREDYIDDLGLQAAQALWGYLGKKVHETQSKKFDHYLGEIYVEVNKSSDQNEIKRQIAEMLKKMEDSETEEARSARRVSEMCILAQYETRFNYRTYHDLLIWESDIVNEKLLDKAMSMLMSSGSIKRIDEGEYKGCVVIDLESIDLPNELAGSKEKVKVLIRSDGTATYLAKDIAFHLWKFGLIKLDFKYSEFIKAQPNSKPLYTTSKTGIEREAAKKAKIAINIIDYRQSQEQLLLRVSLEIIGGKSFADKVKHLAYGLVNLESGALSGRKGTWIGYTADDILDEAIKRARDKIGERFKLTESEKDKIANSIALSSIKFEFLRVSSEKNIIFSWGRAMSFDGDSGPYCQYMCARASRIIADSKIDHNDLINFDPSRLSDQISFDLVKRISIMGEIVEKACIELKPNIITDYLIELSYSFSKFYESVPVLKSDKDDKMARLALLHSFRETAAYALKLLGIDSIERM